MRGLTAIWQLVTEPRRTHNCAKNGPEDEMARALEFGMDGA